MPRSKLTINQTVQNARSRINRIITNYDSRDLLLIQANAFKRTRNPSLKQAYNDYINLNRNESILKRYNETINDDLSSSSNQHLRQQQRRPQDPPPFVVANSAKLSSTLPLVHNSISSTPHYNQRTSTIRERISTTTTASNLPPSNATPIVTDNLINDDNENNNEKCDNCQQIHIQFLIQQFGESYNLNITITNSTRFP